MLDGLLHRQPLLARVFARDDDVHIVTALDAVVKAGEQAVGIGRQIHAHDVGLLVGDVVEETGVLMREAVVVLLPDVGGEDIVEGGDIVAPGELIAHLEPLGVLGKHRVDNADEGLVAVKEAVAARQQVTFEEALAEVLGEHGVHHAAVGVKVLVDALDLLVEEAAARDVKHGLQTVGRRLVGCEDAEVARLHVELHHIADIGAKDVHVLRLDLAGGGDIDRVVAEVGRAQVAQEKTAVGVRVCAHAVLALGREGRDQLDRRTVLVEELFGLVRAQPLFEQRQVLAFIRAHGDRHLMGAPAAFDCVAVDLLRTGPALRGAQHEHRPAGAARLAAFSRGALDALDLADGPVDRGGHLLVHRLGLVTLDKARLPAAAAEEALDLLVAHAGEDGRICDLEAV